MQIHQLKRKTPNTKRMIVARGGKRGKTAGRGGKGQSARAGNKRRPEWRDIIKRLPKLRGRGVNQNKFITERAVVVDLSEIEKVFAAKDLVTPTTLVEKGIVSTMSGRIPPIKILANGELTKAVNVSGCFISGSAKALVEKAGGSVESIIPVITQKAAPVKVTAATKKS
ncbi:MAG: ribosomal protein L15 [Parcubacteria bacterium C7867-002]|nr:MAG: ribosomal protein L15 [Parcubacteria bacterium C7867-002]